MKKNERFTKAVATIFIIGFSLLYNTNLNVTKIANSGKCTTENFTTDDTIKVSENSFIIYTKSIIKQGINHLISNL